MAGLTGGTKDNILEELRGSIYFNPEINGYEIADKYIAGNVIEKAERVERFLEPKHHSLGHQHQQPDNGLYGSVYFFGVVCHKPHFADPEVDEYLRAGAVIAQVRRKPQ